MPRHAHTPQMVQATRQRILAQATELIGGEGFEAFSMRRLARRLGMTVANIYNYYPNKNALYLDIQTKGFEQLQRAFIQVSTVEAAAGAQLVGFARAYVRFALEHPQHYQVMLGSNTPKYADYVDTKHEPLARREKRAAVALIDLTEQVLRRVAAPALSGEPPRIRAIRLWSALHGVVSLALNRVLAEVSDQPEEIIEAVIASLVRDVTAGAAV